MKKIASILGIVLICVCFSLILFDSEDDSILSNLPISGTGDEIKGGDSADTKSNDSKVEEEEIATLQNVDEETNVKVTRNISAECTWAFDVTNPLKVYEDADYFLKVSVKTKEKTKYFVENTIMPSSTYNVKVLEVLKNDDDSIPKNIKLAVNGGIVTVQDYVNTMDEGTKSKANVDKLSKKELEEYVLINDESYYELEQKKEYFILVRDLTEDEAYKGYYGLPDGGYDVFEEINGEYVNVLTKKVLTIPK